MKKIGFIGLGIMGQGMATNILAHGFKLNVWNRTRPKMENLVQRGADSADKPADLAAKSEAVIICVTDEAAVEQVLFGPDGVSAGARPETLIIDMSTISPQASRQHAAALAAKGFSMLDAPVSGSREGADQGSLSIMAGGGGSRF